MSKPGVRLIAVTAALATAGLTAAPAATAATVTETAPTTTAATTAPAAGDPFYAYDGSEPLSSFAPGAVLKTRTLQYHLVGIPTPLKAIQLLHRSTDAQGRPSANVTTVVRSLTGDGSKAVSYQSFYDSLNPEDGPSRAIAGNLTLGGVIPNAEALFMAPLLAKGYTLVIRTPRDSGRTSPRGPSTGPTPWTRSGPRPGPRRRA
ncbi:hypothetical protein [Streptomyces gardneri]|uniref:hypothetical protein n=1 Tax=Streptomyces gardneri TaxID=66892 RepID=UPI0035DE145D